MRAVKSVTIDSERRVIITFLDGSTETLYPNCIWCDLEALRQLIKDLLEEKANAIVQTINNVTVATFEDGASEALIRKLLVSIEPIQDLHGYDSPWPAGGGKNKFTNVGETTDEYIGTDDTPTTYEGWCFSDYLPVLPNTVYTFNPNSSEGGLAKTWFYDSNKDGISYISSGSRTFTTPNNCAFMRFSYRSASTNIQLEIGSEATSYAPYSNICPIGGRTGLTVYRSGSDTANPTEFPVNWETEAGTVYGGTLDVISGKLVVNKKLCKISDLTFTYNTQYGRFETTSLSSVIKLPPNNTTRLGGLTSSIYTVRLPSNTGSSPINNSIAVVSVPAGYVYIRDERYDNISDFITGAGDQTISYPLAEPIEYQLTAQEITTLLGTNNIWTDSGDILELEYVADTKLYIGESQSGTLGSGRQSISNTDLQPVSEKTVEDLSEAVKAETAEKETQEETYDERGE